MPSTGSINKFVDRLFESKMEKNGAILLMGEECSLRAGMPTASEWVAAIKKSFPQAYEHARAKDLSHCAAELTITQKYEVFRKYLKKAKVSWAHLCIALLMKEGFLSRVYTTYPDPLLERACALVGEFPAVYDCTVGGITKPDLIPPKSIIHLKGQILGATPSSLEGVFSSAGRSGPWLVLGYQPDSKDPVYEQIAWLDNISKGLLWVYSGNHPPARFIQDQIFSKENNHYTHADDPDTFLVTLIRMMKIGIPELIGYPFTFLGHWLNKVSPYPAPGHKDGLNIADISLKQTKAAIQQFEGPERGADIGDDEQAAGGVDDPDLLKAIQAARTGLIAGEPKKVIEQHKQFEETPSVQLGHLLNWAYQVEGDSAVEEARKLDGPKALEKLKAAQSQYEMALKIRQDSPHTHLKLGRLLVDQVKTQPGKNAGELLEQGALQFKKAIELNPDFYEANYDLGMVLTELAGTKTDPESDQLYESAAKQFQEGLRLQPNHPEAAYGAGHVLFSQARRKKGADAVQRYTQAVEMFKIALHGNPERTDAMLEMGQALFILAKTKKGEDVDRFLMMAEEKFQQAIQVNSTLAEAQFGWADVLMERATLKSDETSDRFFNKAFEKYQAVLKLNPDMPRVNFRWAVGQHNLAMKKSGEEAVSLLKEAAAKFKQALQRTPKNIEIMNRLGHVYLELGNYDTNVNAERLYTQAIDHFQDLLKLQPNNYKALSQVGEIYFQISMLKSGKEAESLVKVSIEKFQDALKLKADYSRAIILWGNSLFRLANFRSGDAKEDLYNQAEKKYEQALKIHPNDATALRNFGSILLTRAKKEKSDKVGPLLDKAIDSFQVSIEIQENNPEALNMMGEALITQAKSKRGIDAHPLLAEAKGVLQKADEYQPGIGCYNMAKLQAQLANETGCRQWLERCQEHGVLPDAVVLNEETLFASVRESKWFKNLLPVEEAPQEGQQEEEKKEITMAVDDSTPATAPAKETKPANA
jgi:tetratricopeptide (TPR) repeat protein